MWAKKRRIKINESKSVHRILIGNHILKSFWTEYSCCASKSYLQKIQRSQKKVLRFIVNAPWYIRHSDVHRELMMDTITKIAMGHKKRIQQHVSAEAIQLLAITTQKRRLEWMNLYDVVL